MSIISATIEMSHVGKTDVNVVFRVFKIIVIRD